MRTIKKRYVVFLLLIIVAVAIVACVPFKTIYSLPSQIYLASGDLEYINNQDVFGKFISLEHLEKPIKTASQNIKQDNSSSVIFKLFNLIPIKKQSVKILPDDKIFAGGMAVGLVIQSEGALVVGSSGVKTKEGEVDICKKYDLKVGDIITYIDDVKIENTSSISSYLNKRQNKETDVNLKVLRDNEEKNVKVKPSFDQANKIYRLGVWVRDDASGIGTLTYIDKNNRFGALGHPICDGDTKTIVNVKGGGLYNCSILGVNKGVSGSPGEIRELFLQGKNQQGYIDKNNTFGIFGEVKQDSNLFERAEPVKIGGRYVVKPGKAQIRCCIDGNNIKMYDIEIVKTNYQNYSNDKSMIIRVVDKELLSKAGGIVQGMSGSPIIQDGKLIGAVTHVFVNDPTKGYGVYLDWMIKE